MSDLLHVPRWRFAAAGAALLLLALGFAGVDSLRSRADDVAAGLANAQPGWLWVAGVLFVGGIVCSAGAWRCAFVRCGACIGFREATTWYGTGSLANTLAPARLGDVVRATLFAKRLDASGRAWTAGGALAAVGVARALVLLGLVLVATIESLIPAWPLIALAGIGAAAVVLALVARRIGHEHRVAHALDAFREFGRAPRKALALFAWAAAATLAKLAAATTIAVALHAHAPFTAAFLIVPTLEFAAIVPITPGNLGIAGGAVALALRSSGVSTDTALAIGIALNAVETIAGLGFGLLCAAALTAPTTSAGYRWRAAIALASLGTVAAAAFAASAFVDFT